VLAPARPERRCQAADAAGVPGLVAIALAR